MWNLLVEDLQPVDAKAFFANLALESTEYPLSIFLKAYAELKKQNTIDFWNLSKEEQLNKLKEECRAIGEQNMGGL